MNIFQEHLESYIDYCKNIKGLSLKTTDAYFRDISQLIVFLEDGSFSFTKPTIEAYVKLLSANYKTKTIKRKLASIKAYTNWLCYEEILESNPFQNIRLKIKEAVVLPKIIPFDVLCEIIQVAYKNIELNKNTTEYKYGCSVRNAAIIEVLFATGIRVSELCQLKQSMITKDYCIRIVGKGNKERIIQIGNKDVIRIFKKHCNLYSSVIESKGYIFTNRDGNKLSEASVRVIINNIASQTGTDFHITPHMFRHSFATYLLDEGVDIRYIQSFLGHSSIMTTQIYTYVSTKKQNAILTLSHPRNRMEAFTG